MLKNLGKYFFPFLVILAALSVSACAAYYSVTGLSKLFAGASLAVIIMASSLEASKLIVASFLYRYWSGLNYVLKSYMMIATALLVLITSVGIYGFLSSAYQETASKSEIINKEINVLELKKQRYEEDRASLLTEKTALDESISSLRGGLSNQIQYKDQQTGQIITTTSSTNRRVLNEQIEQVSQSRDQVNSKLDVLNDSISKFEIKIIEIQSNSDVASELGPLIYLSELTNKSMDSIINYLLLIIIFIFDPLAISLVIAANYAFEKAVNAKEEAQEQDSEGEQADEEDQQENEPVEENEQVIEEEKNLEEEEPVAEQEIKDEGLKSFLDDEDKTSKPEKKK